ncbi:hypothetical protein K503DRAFT_805525 [Rhizopogon vinicolor AM-OR11-026]|uniref:Uncharacterized protein n=1 Tax=Rhizopogon vinicolor AM-OR11-026 TaxID=1314800 RepID=A0A1B7MHM7_9AGAM|nr:hypothetical protein K503DRAFT_805525 [Rhizopogon vinicolor AM-OR11-026]
MVQDITPQLTVCAPINKNQDITQQETQPEPPSSFLNGDDTMEEGRNDPHENFLSSSQSSFTPAPSDPSRKRRLQNFFSKLSVLRLLVNQSMRLRERLKRSFRVHAPANSNQGERTPEGMVGGG